MRSKVLLAALLLGRAAFGQTPPAPAPEKPASIEGTVTHATTGEPLPRVHVTLRANTNGTAHLYGAMTAPDGKFSVTGIVPGNYTVTAERTGFVMPPGTPAFTSASLNADEKKSDLNLKLLPTGGLTGRVTDSEGEPVEGANVNAEGSASGGNSATTDEKGQFRIGGLAPGKYRVRASNGAQMPYGPEIRSDGTADVHYAVTYYPGVLATKEAGRVEVRSDGETGGVEIQLIKVPWVKVSGKVTGSFRRSDNVFIQAVKEGGMNMGAGAATKSDGSFVLWRLDPGRYYIRANWNAPNGQYMRSGPVEVEVAGSNVENIELRIISNFDIAGRLEFESEEAKQMPQPPQAQQASTQQTPAQAAQQPKPQRRLTLREIGTGSQTAAPIQVQDDDTFVFKQVSPGRYRVAPSWNTAYVKSTRLGSTVADGAVIDVSGGPAGDLSLMMSAANASLTGTVQDEKDNPAGTLVILAPEKADPSVPPRYAQVKADGTYSFPNLPPGGYRIAAVQRNDLIPVSMPGGFLDYEDLMEPLELHDGDKVTKDLKRRVPGER